MAWDLPDYTERGSLGYDPEVGGQAYGLKDLQKLYEGFTEGGDLLDYGSFAEETDIADFYGGEYDPAKEEGLLRQDYAQDYRGHKQNLAGLLSQSRANVRTANVKRGKSGFAGGGAASRTANLQAGGYIPQVRSARKSFQRTKLDYIADVLGKRTKYVDDLWSRYQDYAVEADTDAAPITAAWEAEYEDYNPTGG